MKSKIFLSLFLAALFASAIVIPTINTIVTGEYDNIFVLNANEEESKSEHEKNADDKNLFFDSLPKQSLPTFAVQNSCEFICLVKYPNIAFEIVSPPPEAA